MQMKAMQLGSILVIAALLHGCAAVVIGAAAAGTGGAAMTMLSDRRAGNISTQDDQIAENIIARLKQDPSIPENARVQVFSFNRIVLLAGETPKASLRNQIVEIARAVPGIRKIHNEIILAKPLANSSQEYDMQIRIRGSAALFASPNVRSSQVHLTVSNQVVYVMGLLTRAEANAAIEVVRNLDGVKKVVSLVEYVRFK